MDTKPTHIIVNGKNIGPVEPVDVDIDLLPRTRPCGKCRKSFEYRELKTIVCETSPEKIGKIELVLFCCESCFKIIQEKAP